MEKKFGVISADGHCRLIHFPFDLWTKRLLRKFQDNGPRMVQRPAGTRSASTALHTTPIVGQGSRTGHSLA